MLKIINYYYIIPLAHYNTFWMQKLMKNVSFWTKNIWINGDPETDILRHHQTPPKRKPNITRHTPKTT